MTDAIPEPDGAKPAPGESAEPDGAQRTAEAPSPPRLRVIVVTILKWLVVLVALAYLILSGRLSLEGVRIRSGGAPWLLLSGLFIGLLMLLSFVRYYLLLFALNFRFRFVEVVRICMIGAFFNTFMLGGVGGDVVKLAYVARSHGRRAAAVASVMVDRVMGLMGLMSLGGGAMLLGYRQLLTNPRLHPQALLTLLLLGGVMLCSLISLVSLLRGRGAGLLLWGGGLLCALGVGLYLSEQGALALSGEARPIALLRGRILLILALQLTAAGVCIWLVPSCMPGRTVAKVLEHRVPGGGALLRLVQAVLYFRQHVFLLVLSLLLSVVAWGIALLAVYGIGQGLAMDPSPNLSHVAFCAPMAFLSNSLPLPGGGLGVGETVFGLLLENCVVDGQPVTGGASMFLALRLLLILAGLCGLPFYLLGVRTEAATTASSDSPPLPEESRSPAPLQDAAAP